MARVFDTYKSSLAFDHFVKHDVPDGFIVVAACKDDCVTKLSKAAKQWFRDMGSKEIDQLEYRQGFVFIGVAGQKQAHEKRAAERGHLVQATQVFVITPEFSPYDFTDYELEKKYVNRVKDNVCDGLDGVHEYIK